MVSGYVPWAVVRATVSVMVAYEPAETGFLPKVAFIPVVNPDADIVAVTS